MDGPWKRALVKLSGEALMGAHRFGIDRDAIAEIADQLASASRDGLEIGIVVGGGNFWRGSQAAATGMDRATADYAGMLGTIMNALALQDSLENAGAVVRTMTAIPVHQVAEPYIQRRALRHLEKGRVVLFAAGTGNPYMTTDTAAALRAVETHSAVLLMAKNGVDGVYDADPREVPGAKKFDQLTHLDALQRQLQVMDSTALSLCMDNDLPVVVFDIAGPRSIYRALTGERIGTIVGANPAEES